MSTSWSAVGGAAAAALLLGLAFGSWLRAPAPEPAAAPVAAARREPGPAAEELARLQRELDIERGRTGALELELALLRHELAPAAPAPSGPDPAPDPGDPGARNADAKDAKPANAEWFDTKQLTEIGVDERHAEYIRERFEELQMDELYLRDQATRDRWIHKPRYGAEFRALSDEARAAIGDDDYDRMLYASGRHNRVLLSSVLNSSPAGDAGILAGDVLVRYGDHPIYDLRDLLAETTSGKLGETTSIDVERNGELLRFYVERGPLGAKIQPIRRPPADRP